MFQHFLEALEIAEKLGQYGAEIDKRQTYRIISKRDLGDFERMMPSGYSQYTDEQKKAVYSAYEASYNRHR